MLEKGLRGFTLAEGKLSGVSNIEFAERIGSSDIWVKSGLIRHLPRCGFRGQSEVGDGVRLVDCRSTLVNTRCPRGDAVSPEIV